MVAARVNEKSAEVGAARFRGWVRVRGALWARVLVTDAVVVGRDNGLWRPVLTWALAALFVAGYFRQLAAGPFTGQRFYDLGAFATGPGLVENWRALTAPYMHADITHLVLNLLGLSWIGRLVEARLTRLQFVLTWFIASSGSFLLLGLIESDVLLTVGASGGVLGLLGAGIAIIASQRRTATSKVLDRALRWLLVIVAVQLALDQVVESVSWIGHLTGLGIGVVAGAFWARMPRPTDERDHATADNQRVNQRVDQPGGSSNDARTEIGQSRANSPSPCRTRFGSSSRAMDVAAMLHS